MDRDIIAPGPDLYWHVSNLIDPRRSNGEKEIAEIAGKSVLLPKDPAFHPEAEGLRWRIEKLTAWISKLTRNQKAAYLLLSGVKMRRRRN